MKRLFVYLLLFLLACPLNVLAEDLYVDNASTGSNNGSSWTNAWQTLGAVVWGDGAGKVSAGDTLYISGGSGSKTYKEKNGGFYSSYTVLLVNTDGSEGSPITILAGSRDASPSGHDGTVIIDASTEGNEYGITINHRDYITIDGEKTVGSGINNIQIVGSVTGVNNYYGKNVKVKYLDIEASGTGILSSAMVGGEIAYNVITGVSTNIGINASDETVGADYGAGSIHHNSILVAAARAQAGCDSICGPDGIVTGADSIDIYENTINTTNAYTSVTGSHQDGIHATSNYLRIYKNTIKNIYGTAYIFLNVYAASIGHVVWGNLLYRDVSGTTVNGAILYGGHSNTESCSQISIYGNTIVDIYGNGVKGIGISCDDNAGGGGLGVLSAVEIKNNLLINSGGIAVQDSTGEPVCGIDIIIDYNAGGNGAHGAYSVYCLGEAYSQAHGRVDPTNGTVAFVGYSENASTDLRLSSSDTLAKDYGVALGAPYNTDIIGTSRPQGAAWDIGAYEYYEQGSIHGVTSMGVSKK